MGLTLIGVSNAIVGEFDTAEARKELGAVVAAVPPILQGLAGKPVNVETLGGYLQYKYGTFFPLIVQPVVDPRPVRDARRGGPSRQPGVRRRDRDHPAAHRAREAGSRTLRG